MPVVEALPATEPPAIHCSAAEQSGLIKKERKFLGET